MIAKLRRLNPRHVLPDAAITVFSFYASLYLRLGSGEIQPFLPILTKHIALFVVIRLATFAVMGVYDIIWRYISMQDVTKLVRGMFLSQVLILSASYIVDIGRLPRTTFIIEFVLGSALIMGIRVARRMLYDSERWRDLRRTGRRTLIIGAGSNGRTLANRFKTDQDIGLRVVGFVDNDPQKVSREIAGLKVLGACSDLPELIRDYRIQEIVVAIAKPETEMLRQVVRVAATARIRPKLVSAASTASGGKPFQISRPVELSDLLNRPRRTMDLLPIRSLLQGKTVLITGAGGSIGSELARQVSSFGPSRLLLLDHAEFNLYQIDQELRKFSSDADFISPVLVDIKDAASLHNVFELNRPQIVLHAAAYKHVHLVEHNPCPSILNNVLGTRNLLEMCSTFDVDTFVMISTDKAVNPVGVMGATKRVCELMVTETGRRLGRRYCSVRFGNVLGSSGSLIPLLKDQIEKREPVTITHPDMTRYFMLIPEAVSLVLRASTLASPGDISLLDMGKPVKIVDIARSLISLMGHSEEESPIVFTGLRPGEKLFEELYMCGNEIKTDDPDILVVPHGDGGGADWLPTEIDSSVVRLLQLAATNSPDSVRTLHSIVRASFVAPSPQASSAELAAVHERTLPDAPLNQLH